MNIKFEENIKRREIILSVLVISLTVTLYCQYPLLINRYAINDDVRADIYHYLRYRDSELFKNDPITTYYSKYNPLGLDIFYFFISLFCNPVYFTKILPFILCALSALYMYRLGKLFRSNITGFLASLVFIFFVWSRVKFEVFGTGNGEDFAVFFYIMFIYYFFKKDFLKTNIVLVLLSLFYPPLLILCLLIYFFMLIRDLLKDYKIEKKRLVSLIATFFLIFLVLYGKYLNGYIKMTTLKDMKNMEEFFPGGRKVVFHSTFYERWISNEESGLAVDYPMKWIIFITLLIFLVLKKKALCSMPFFLWISTFASFVLFIISNIFMYSLYGPSRYVRHPLPIFLIFFITINMDEIVKRFKDKYGRLVFLSSLVLLTSIFFIPRLHARYIIGSYPSLYNFLKTLPKDILIAGHPTFMDNIPVFAERKVLVNEETSEPFHKVLYPIVKERTCDFFKAYYSNSFEEIRNFCRKYNVDYLIVNKEHFSKDYIIDGNFYLKPFNEYVENLTRNKDSVSFALMNISEDKKIFKEGDIFVIRTKDFLIGKSNDKL